MEEGEADLCIFQEMGIKRWGYGGEVEDGYDRHEQ